MIDFRYHLVSIVSIFLALAVGIVLGAGPLQQQIGQTLTNQVSQLRQDKSDLRSQLDTQQHSLEAADEFAAAVTPELVGSRLGGRSVVLVLLPGAESAVADDITATMKTAGATVNGRIKLTSAWADPDPGKVAFRDQLSSNLGPLVGSTASPTASVNEQMGAILAKGLMVSSVAEADRVTEQSEQALSGLKEAGLITIDGPSPKLSTLVVTVVGGPVTKMSDDARNATLTTWKVTASQLDKGASGSVVAGPLASSEPIGVIGAIRADRAVAAQVSTVDDVQLAMSQPAIVFALLQQMSGGSGQYGTGVGATAVLPPLPSDES
ncbi:copper transporter [Angustibacter sp. McL0619]|uniref:copper transporter n=1 Tax=Angustibacter sp. McL0619 TaxID=3415676 RepID=UPI003CF9E870